MTPANINIDLVNTTQADWHHKKTLTLDKYNTSSNTKQLQSQKNTLKTDFYIHFAGYIFIYWLFAFADVGNLVAGRVEHFP